MLPMSIITEVFLITTYIYLFLFAIFAIDRAY